jgi:hypothetical protein
MSGYLPDMNAFALLLAIIIRGECLNDYAHMGNNRKICHHSKRVRGFIPVLV